MSAQQTREQPWRTTATGPTRCRNCGAHVTAAFARTFGDDHDTVHACRACAPAREIFEGAAARRRADR